MTAALIQYWKKRDCNLPFEPNAEFGKKELEGNFILSEFWIFDIALTDAK